jgi:hypothetical protein
MELTGKKENQRKNPTRQNIGGFFVEKMEFF